MGGVPGVKARNVEPEEAATGRERGDRGPGGPAGDATRSYRRGGRRGGRRHPDDDPRYGNMRFMPYMRGNTVRRCRLLYRAGSIQLLKLSLETVHVNV